MSNPPLPVKHGLREDSMDVGKTGRLLSPISGMNEWLINASSLRFILLMGGCGQVTDAACSFVL